MVALAIVLSAMVVLLTVLVAGLLRSHADILKSLHDLGAGIGDPGAMTVPEGSGSGSVPVVMGPPLPGERSSGPAPTVVGVTPGGDALAVSTGGDHLTLLAFLSSGCATCAAFWKDFRVGVDGLGLPSGTRLVVVTKGPELEIPAEVAAQASPGLAVVMSTDSWVDYEIPGSPFFVLVDGRTGRRIGEGVANRMEQVVELVRRAESDVRPFAVGSRSRTYADGLDGPARELDNDRELMAAGIFPGDPSLYPSSHEELHGPAQRATRPGPPTRRAG